MAQEELLIPTAGTQADGLERPLMDAAPSSTSARASSDAPTTSELLAILYRQVAALAGPRQDLDDLVQAAAERVLKSLHRFDGRSALTTWTYTIAYRTVIDSDRWRARFRKRFVTSDTAELDRRSSDWDSDAALLQLERARRLHDALNTLPPKKRAVVVLVEFEGLELREVSEIVCANERTVRSRLRDARKKLAQALSADPLFGGQQP